MANLRTNNLSGEQGQNAIRGSLGFHGSENSTDYLQIGSAGDFNYLHDGTSDWTAEFFVRSDQLNHRQTVFSTGGNSSSIGFACRIMEDGSTGGSNGYKVFCQFSRGASGNYLGFEGGVIDNKDFSHVALVFTTSNKQLAIYINGQLTNSSDLDGTAANTFGSGDFSSSNSTYAFTIGRENFGTTLYMDSGFISNLRIVEGETVYTADFTPPTTELTIIPNTTLLCCQDSNNPTQEATGKTITANGNFADLDFVKQQPKVIPPVGGDAGNAFGGPIQQSSQGYMYFPTGRTEERVTINNNFGTRGLVFQGLTYPNAPSSSYLNSIEFITVASKGDATDFGDLISKNNSGAGAGNLTRGIQVSGNDPNGATNVIQFVTIASTGNAQDFGDVTYNRCNAGAVSNQTRLVYSGGESLSSPYPQLNNIEFILFATTGNATDFGDQIDTVNSPYGVSSPTRGVFMGGSGATPVIQKIEIATTGNSVLFGDLTSALYNVRGTITNGHRGIMAGGVISPTGRVNNIDFITIQSGGKSLNFGDLTDARDPSNLSSMTRGVMLSGDYPANVNIMDFIEIMTTGNAVDFGDCNKSSASSTASNCHGGLADVM